MNKAKICCPKCGYELMEVNQEKVELRPMPENIEFDGLDLQQHAGDPEMKICGKCYAWDRFTFQALTDPAGSRRCKYNSVEKIDEKSVVYFASMRRCWHDAKMAAIPAAGGSHIERPLGGLSGGDPGAAPDHGYPSEEAAAHHTGSSMIQHQDRQEISDAALDAEIEVEG